MPSVNSKLLERIGRCPRSLYCAYGFSLPLFMYKFITARHNAAHILVPRTNTASPHFAFSCRSLASTHVPLDHLFSRYVRLYSNRLCVVHRFCLNTRASETRTNSRRNVAKSSGIPSAADFTAKSRIIFSRSKNTTGNRDSCMLFHFQRSIFWRLDCNLNFYQINIRTKLIGRLEDHFRK